MVLTIKDFVNDTPRAPRAATPKARRAAVALQNKKKTMKTSVKVEETEAECQYEETVADIAVTEVKTHSKRQRPQQLPLVVENWTNITSPTETESETTRNPSNSRNLAAIITTASTFQTTVSEGSHTTHTSRSSTTILLHDLIANRQWKQAMERLYMAPKEASKVVMGVLTSHKHKHDEQQQKQQQNCGNLALHEACKHRAPIELINLLLELYPSAVSTKGQYGYLPLHFAVCSRADPEIVARLLELYPSATRHKDNTEGKLPLHLATKWGASEQALILLMTVHPEAANMQDDSGKTPMEHAEFVAQTSPTGTEMSIMAQKAIRWLSCVAPLLQVVHQTAQDKMYYQNQQQWQQTVDSYRDRFRLIQEQYTQDHQKAEHLEQELRNDLEQERSVKEQLQNEVLHIQKRHEQLQMSAERMEQDLRNDLEQERITKQELQNEVLHIQERYEQLQQSVERLEQDLRNDLELERTTKQQLQNEVIHIQEQYEQLEQSAERLQQDLRDNLEQERSTKQQLQNQLLHIQEQYKKEQRKAEILQQEFRGGLEHERTTKQHLQHQVQQLLLQQQQHQQALHDCRKSVQSEEKKSQNQRIQELERQLQATQQELSLSNQVWQQLQGLVVAREIRESRILPTSTTTVAATTCSQQEGSPHDDHDDDQNVENKRDALPETRDPPPSSSDRSTYHDDDVRVTMMKGHSISMLPSAKRIQNDYPNDRNHVSGIHEKLSRNTTTSSTKDLILKVFANGDDDNHDDSTRMAREEHMAETREPFHEPPSARVDMDDGHFHDDYHPLSRRRAPVRENQILPRDVTRHPSPRSNAVASVKNWFASETEALSHAAEDDLLSRLLASEKEFVGKQEPNRTTKASSKLSSLTEQPKEAETSRTDAIRHGYAANNTRTLTIQKRKEGSSSGVYIPSRIEQSREQYRHYQQEYESLLNRSKSNLRRRIESTTTNTTTAKTNPKLYSKGSWERKIPHRKEKGHGKGRSQSPKPENQNNHQYHARNNNHNYKPVEVIITKSSSLSGGDTTKNSAAKSSVQLKIQQERQQEPSSETVPVTGNNETAATIIHKIVSTTASQQDWQEQQQHHYHHHRHDPQPFQNGHQQSGTRRTPLQHEQDEDDHDDEDSTLVSAAMNE